MSSSVALLGGVPLLLAGGALLGWSALLRRRLRAVSDLLDRVDGAVREREARGPAVPG